MAKQKKKILFEKFQDDTSSYKEKEEIGKKLNIDSEKIIVKKESIGTRIYNIVYDLIFSVGKVILIIVNIALVSFALTVLINRQLREAVFAIIATW